MTTQAELTALMCRAGRMVGQGRVERRTPEGSVQPIFVAVWEHEQGRVEYGADGKNDWTFQPKPAEKNIFDASEVV